MPIYEFYCKRCNMIFNFFSSKPDTETVPTCPRCKKTKLSRRVSVFSTLKRKGDEDIPFDIDESRMEKAIEALSKEADHIDENDPKQAANLMRKLTEMTGLNLSPRMEEALRRMEAGEDPDQIEQEMGDLLEDEKEPFTFKDKGVVPTKKISPPKVDDKLYFL